MSDCCENKKGYLYACSGGSDVGFLSDRVARMLSVVGYGSMYCLAGIGGNIENFIKSAKIADRNIVIDGCDVRCGKKIMDNNNISCESYVITEFGFEKSKTGVSEDIVKQAFLKINPIVEKKTISDTENITDSDNSCCCGG